MSPILIVLLPNALLGVLWAAINYGPWAVAIISALVLLTWFALRWMRVVATYDARVARLISEIKP